MVLVSKKTFLGLYGVATACFAVPQAIAGVADAVDYVKAKCDGDEREAEIALSDMGVSVSNVLCSPLWVVYVMSGIVCSVIAGLLSKND